MCRRARRCSSVFGRHERSVLLAAYFGSTRAEDMRALELMLFMSDFREAMWAVVQGAVSELDFDFDSYAAEHFERFGDHGTFYAAARNGAGDLAVLAHDHRRAGVARAGSLDVHDAGDRDPLTGRTPAFDISEDFLHAPRLASEPRVRTCRSATDDCREAFNCREGMALDEIVDERQRGGHPASEW